MIAVCLDKGQLSVKKTREPERPPGFAKIRLLFGGICNTDLELQRGYYGFKGTPGHEFVGSVEEADDASLIGKKVVGEINLNCGECEWCLRGLGRHCPNRTVLGIIKHPGAFRTLLTLPQKNLHILPAGLSDTEAVFTEPLAAACQILSQVRIPAGSEIAILGDGKLGLLIAQVLQASGMRVIQFGKHKNKLRISEASGVTGELIGKWRPQSRFDWVVEATGSPKGLQQAVRMTRPLGTIFLKSTMHGEVPVDTAPVIVNEITLVGSRCGLFLPALKLLRAGKINLAPMITEVFPLSEAENAFRCAAEKGALKVLLQGEE